jgi:DNA repair protein RadC
MDAKLRKEHLHKDVSHPKNLYPVMQSILLREHEMRRATEHFWVASLDIKNRLLNVELVNIGAANMVSVQPPEVFRLAIYKAAPRIILVHNHPSGVLVPSHEDKHFTDHMMKVGKLIKIEVCEHLIISETNCFSMRDAGILEELEKSGLFEVTSKVSKEWQEWQEGELKKKASDDRAKQIAIRSIELGLSIEDIVKITGLRKASVGKLLKEIKGK